MRHLNNAGVTPEGIRIMAGKAKTFAIRVDNVQPEAANIIKQQLLSIGGDAAVHRDVISGKPDKSIVYLIADSEKFLRLREKLKGQPFRLNELGKEVKRLSELRAIRPLSVPLPSGSIDFSMGPVIMGVLNITPDSFSDGGLYYDPEAALDKAQSMVEEGARIIDVGGESSRPGADELDLNNELDRVLPVLEKLAGNIDVPVSIDTRKSSVARAAIDSGAVIINDISGLKYDPDMADVVSASRAAVIIMHMQGMPETMQNNPKYQDPVHEIINWLDDASRKIISLGVEREKIIIDPGIGFGKRLNDNLDIIDQSADFHTLGFPVMMGYSRKSFLGRITGRDPTERIPGGLAALGRCLAGEVQILRVHDVKETSDFIRVWNAIERKDTGH